MMAIVLAEHSNADIDILKVLKMLLIHDIVEIDAGDVFLYDNSKNHVNTEEERLAAERIFGILPKEQGDEFKAIWEEFEAAESNEAKFAKSMDRFEPLLQNASNDGGTWAEFDVKLDAVTEKLALIKPGSDVIWEYGNEVLCESVEKGILKK